MLLEFDADQRLWQETVRDAVGKQCPPALVRGVAEDGVDPAPVWKAYVEHGWTEMNDPENAVELAIVLEELGRATDPTPFLATMSQFAPLVDDRFDSRASGTAVYSGVTVHRDGDEWVLDGTARHVLDGDRAEWLAVVTDAAVFVVKADDAAAQLVQTAQRGARSGAACRRPDLQRPAATRCRTSAGRHRAGASRRADGYGDHHGRCVPTHPGSGPRSRAQPPPVRGADRIVSGGPAQGRRHARRYRAGTRPCLLLRVDDRRRTTRAGGWPPRWRKLLRANANRWYSATACSCSARWASPGRTTCSSR